MAKSLGEQPKAATKIPNSTQRGLSLQTVAKNSQICQKLSKASKTWQKMLKVAQNMAKGAKKLQKVTKGHKSKIVTNSYEKPKDGKKVAVRWQK